MRTLIALALSLFVLCAVTPASAQSAFDAERAATMDICTTVINLQYESDDVDKPRWLDCVRAVEAFLVTVGAVGPAADPEIALLVEELVELYQFDDECRISETELPLAITTAAESTDDDEIEALYLEIAVQIANCEFEGLAAIPASAA